MIENFDKIIKGNVEEINRLASLDISQRGKGIVYMNKDTGELGISVDNLNEWVKVYSFEDCINCNWLYDCDNSCTEEEITDCWIGQVKERLGIKKMEVW